MQLPLNLSELPGGLSFALYQSLGERLRPGHAVELVENGAIFAALEREILRARESVHLIVYIWRPCAASDRIADAILKMAGEGVACRVVVDPVGSEDLTGKADFDRDLESRLRRGGCDVRYFRPLAGKVLGRLTGRNHRKLLVVDGRVGITGGFGLWKSWEGNGLEREQWRDTHVRVTGPAVRKMQLAFSRDWQESGGPPLSPQAFPELDEPQGEALAAFVASDGRPGVTDAERLIRVLLASAQRRVWIANAYFVPPAEVLELLEAKARAGVDVRVLGPGDIHDVKPILHAQRATYEQLLRAGVRIWEYLPSMMHAKTLVIDGVTASVGSINLDPLSLNKLGEGALAVQDRSLAQQLEESFVRDCTHAREITLSSGGRSSLRRRFWLWVVRLLGKDR